jgi:hypothetical protein
MVRLNALELENLIEILNAQLLSGSATLKVTPVRKLLTKFENALEDANDIDMSDSFSEDY